MAAEINYNSRQLTVLVLLRVFIGWHFLYEGLSKLVNPEWSSVAFLLDSEGFLSSFFYSLALDPGVLKIVDFLNIWGLILIGLGLILGLFSRISIIAGMALLAMYYLSHPPFVAYTYSVPSEGSYLWVNKNLIELAALAVLFVYPTAMHVGLDSLIFKRKIK
ncbi:MAG: DoxX family membrane protein [Bacteroidales bacterium]|nr:DoxX family membrane protein [Bacteroidales bacterium]